MTTLGRTREDLYEETAATFHGVLDRLARAYERDPDKRRDLLQEIHLALWRSLEHFEGRCSLSTWVYRVAHNTATSVIRRQARGPTLVGLEDVLLTPSEESRYAVTVTHEDEDDLRSLWELIHKLRARDRQIILLYLEGLDAGSIGEITGLSPGNISTKLHRIRNILSHQFHEGQRRGQ